jgi:hypothetical protein
MGERYQNVEKSSVGLRDVVPSRQLLMTRDITATKICLKSLVILMEGRRRPSFCWQVVRTRVLYLPRVGWFVDVKPVQSRDLASAMRSALTTRNLADCAGLILKTVSMTI